MGVSAAIRPIAGIAMNALEPCRFLHLEPISESSP
jgi:hypothetical protein